MAHTVQKNGNTEIIDTLLLLALPASGKSEVRKYMANLSPEQCRDDMHMGPTLQLDDFPYVHMMRRVDDELKALGHARVFFLSGEKPFTDPRDWGTLIQLINEDYADLRANRTVKTRLAAESLLARIEEAAKKVGIPERLSKIDKKTMAAVCDALEREAKDMLNERNELCSSKLNGKTIVIEFARGGAHGSAMPLKAPFGYAYSLAQLSDEILKRARILYVWVTPEESRRKNHERANPNDPGSILHHGVPTDVMMNDYGCDDMLWLEENAEKKGVVTVKTGKKTYHLPIARFDNRVDKTSFIRANREDWSAKDVQAVHNGLKDALSRLAAF